jgi:site-specific DNA-methyltransferase (adenine-specific)
MNDLIIVKVDKARALLAQAQNATDAKQVLDVAQAAEVYAKRQKFSEECIQYAHAVKVDAMTLLGEFLQKNKPAMGGPGRGKVGEQKTVPDGNSFLPPEVSRKESSDAQALATIKHAQPDLFEKVRSGNLTVSKARREKTKRERRAAHARQARSLPSGNGAKNWEIRHGDCLAELAKIKEGTVRLAFADPPYNIGVDYGKGAKADLLPAAQYQAWCAEWIGAVIRTLAPDGSFWILINDENAAVPRAFFKAWMHLRQGLIWYESFSENNPTGFNRTHRHLFWAVKDRQRFVFNPEAVTRPSDRQTKHKDKRADPEGKTWDSVWGINPPIPRVVGMSKERIEDFPTQLPVALLRAVVGCASDPGDLVLDPFAGSGTTGHACIELGRRFIGIEQSADYCRLARLRLHQCRKLPEKQVAEPPAGEPAAEPERKILGVGIDHAADAITCLEKIPRNDLLRKNALQIVLNWIKHNG